MFIEYIRLLGLGIEPEFSIEFISRISLALFSLLAVIYIGYKIKEGWGVVMAIFLWAIFLLYLNGLLPIYTLKSWLSLP